MRVLIFALLLPLTSCALKDALEGEPVFVKAHELSVAGTRDVVAGYFSGDDQLDLVIASSVVRLFTNQGSSGFAALGNNLDVPDGPGETLLLVRDVDGDMSDDLVVATTDGVDSTITFLTTGTGTLEASAGETTISARAVSMAIGPFEGVMVLTQNPSRIFRVALDGGSVTQTLVATVTEPMPFDLVVGNFGGGASFDLAYAYPTGFNVLLGESQDSFPTVLSYSDRGEVLQLAAGDVFANDTQTELVVRYGCIEATCAAVEVVDGANAGLGAIQPQELGGAAAGTFALGNFSIKAGADVVVFATDDPVVHLFIDLDEVAGSFRNKQTAFIDSGTHRMLAVDTNGDMTDDLVVRGSDGVIIYRNTDD